MSFTGINVDSTNLTGLISLVVEYSDYGIGTFDAVVSNIDGENTASMQDVCKCYYDGSLVMEGYLDNKSYDTGESMTLRGRTYGSLLTDYPVEPHTYYMETGRTMTIADVLTGFPYSHGAVKPFDVEPSTSVWDDTNTIDLSREYTTYHSKEYSWKFINGYLMRSIYVDSSLYDKVKVSCWARVEEDELTLNAKSSSDATYTTDTTITTDEWERLEVTEDLEAGDNYFDIKINFDGEIFGYFTIEDDTPTTTNGIAINLSQPGIDTISLTGNTGFSLISSNDYADTAPTGDEAQNLYSAKTENTTNRPNIYIEYTSVGSGDGNTTIYATESQPYLRCTDNTYTKARDGTGTLQGIASDYDYYTVGQSYTVSYYVYRSFMYFDTSSLPDDAVITSAVIYMTCRTVSIDNSFDVYLIAWTGLPTLTSDDWESSFSFDYCYLDDFTYCLHYIDDDSSVWDNGLIANTGLSDTNITCATELSFFETRENENKWSAIERLWRLAGYNDYECYVSPIAKDMIFRTLPDSYNSTVLKMGDNIIDISSKKDSLDLANDVEVISVIPNIAWKELYNDPSYTITSIALVSNDTIIIGGYGGPSATGAISQSTDGGETFTVKETLSTNGDYPYNLTHIDEDGTLYACCKYAGILKSTDDGATWTVDDASLKFGSHVVKLTSSAGTDYYFVGAKDGNDSDAPKIWRKTTGSWSAIYTPANGTFASALTGLNDTLIAGVMKTTGNDSSIYRCADPFAATPTFTEVYSGDAEDGAYGGAMYDADVKLNLQTGTYDFYLTYNATGPVATMLKSADDGITWSASGTFDDANDYWLHNLAVSDIGIYAIVRSNESDKFGRIVQSLDEGATWTTSYLGTSDIEFYQLSTFKNRFFCGANKSDSVYLYYKQDGYTISAESEDSASQTAYGKRKLRVWMGDTYTYADCLALADNYIAARKDPILDIGVKIPLDTSITCSLKSTIANTNTFPLRFPIRFSNGFEDFGSYNVRKLQHDLCGDTTALTLDNRYYDDIWAIQELIEKEQDLRQVLDKGTIVGVDSDSGTADVFVRGKTIYGLTACTTVANGDTVILGYMFAQEGNPTIIAVEQ